MLAGPIFASRSQNYNHYNESYFSCATFARVPWPPAVNLQDRGFSRMDYGGIFEGKRNPAWPPAVNLQDRICDVLPPVVSSTYHSVRSHGFTKKNRQIHKQTPPTVSPLSFIDKEWGAFLLSISIQRNRQKFKYK
jgi:hypothetical protein